jgi:hypothetical protein
MSEPDDLYTLRAQFWMGHYQMAMDEAKSVMRRPMSPELKIEREEFMLRSQLAMGQYDKVIAAAQESGAPGECYKKEKRRNINKQLCCAWTLLGLVYSPVRYRLGRHQREIEKKGEPMAHHNVCALGHGIRTRECS